MRYLPHTEQDIQAMLKVVGVDSLDGLFATIPKDCWRTEPLDLPQPLSEWELNRHMDALAADMAVTPEYKVYLGAGSYDHYIPETIRQLILRGEFFTAYTPYQPEISQGTLQAIYEYQTLVTSLLGMDVANASMYDGASGLAEALLMSIRVSRRKKVAVSTAINPLYREVVKTYLAPTGYEIIELPYGADGRTDLSGLPSLDELAGIAVQSPNFFGCVEDLKTLAARVHTDPKALFIVSFSEPLAYGLLKSPAVSAPTWPAVKARASASRALTADRDWAYLLPRKSACAQCPAGSSARPWTGTASAGLSSPWRPVNSISAARKPRRISAPTRACAPPCPPCTWLL